MNALELLYEVDGLPRFGLPDEVAALYGGTLGFDEPCLFANFVATADGVVAIPSLPQSNKLIAAGSLADRFVMGLLRACADVVVIGSGTLLASPRGLWTPGQAYPDAADGFTEMRRLLARPRDLAVAVLSATGMVDPGHPALAAGAIVVTTDEGTASLAGRMPPAQIVSLGPGPALEASAAVARLRERGHRLILSEGGPRVFGSLLTAGLVDELFLTVAPLLVGRAAGDVRSALVEEADLLPGAGARLLGVRRDGSHLFLRYGLRSS